MTTTKTTICDICESKIPDNEPRSALKCEEVNYDSAGCSGKVNQLFGFADICSVCIRKIRTKLKGYVWP